MADQPVVPGDVDKLLEEHQYLVAKIVKRACAYARSIGVRRLDRDDIKSLAHEGLIKAAMSFEQKKGASSSSYAWLRVMGHIKDELRKEDYLTRRQRQAVQAFIRGDEELTEERERYAMRLVAQRPAASFDPANRLANSDDTEAAALTREVVDSALRFLSPMERAVLKYRYVDGMSVSAIAVLLRVSTGRISQITGAVQTRLREAFEVEAG
jgi:RNA polymerase sigma factor for flagellar operon FliA